MNIKIEDLTPAQLDYAVDSIEGWYADYRKAREAFGDSVLLYKEWNNTSRCHPSTRWELSGPIIEEFAIGIECTNPTFQPEFRWWQASIDGGECCFGPTPLIAAMRCYVQSKLGNEVEIKEI